MTLKILILVTLSLSAALTQPAGATCDAVDLDQGWTPQQSEYFWFTTQGSRLMPYAWFMAMEVSDATSETLFRDRSNMDRYQYIWVPPSAKNPDGLPIGFAKDTDRFGEEHVGLTCSACHTGSLNIAGKRVIVEGGPALSDFWMFLGEAAASLETAAAVPAKFDRFSKRVLKNDNPAQADLDRLRQRMKTKLDDLQTRLTQNASKNPYGYGRVDAFGHIFTHVLAQNFGIPENAHPPYGPEITAPVSYPFLWDTPQHDLVQWNGSAPNSKLLQLGPLGRNLGEVMGVIGDLEIVPGRKVPLLTFLNKPPQFTSSANIPNLVALEATVRKLWSPVWPRNCYPLADLETLVRGKRIYHDNCEGCHRLLLSPERTQESREIVANLLPLSRIGTDPTMAMNFAARKGKTGPLDGSFNLARFELFGAEESGHAMLLAVVNSVLLGGLNRPTGAKVNVAGLVVNPLDEFNGFRRALEASQTPRYKARPLDGVWATAPYLHNGSVPTLWDLLSPVQDRPKVFYLGSRDFDSEKVGLRVEEAPGTFKYDTSPQGNWRNGHEFGTKLPMDQKKDLLEFLKTL